MSVSEDFERMRELRKRAADYERAAADPSLPTTNQAPQGYIAGGAAGRTACPQEPITCGDGGAASRSRASNATALQPFIQEEASRCRRGCFCKRK
jgi:hypothetical protein